MRRSGRRATSPTTPSRNSTRSWPSSSRGSPSRKRRVSPASHMASVQDIKRRIRSVRNTRKITRALELVAAAKLRRAQARIEAMRPYAETMRELIAGVGRAASSVRLPLVGQREQVESVLLIPLAGDRGLAGAFNAQVLRRALSIERQLTGEGRNVQWLAVGKKGRSTLMFRRKQLAGEFVGFVDAPRYADAQA